MGIILDVIQKIGMETIGNVRKSTQVRGCLRENLFPNQKRKTPHPGRKGRNL